MNYFKLLTCITLSTSACYVQANDFYASQNNCCWTDGLSFTAEGLYYKGYEDNLQYATFYNSASDNSVPNVSLSSSSADFKSPTFKDDFGYRLRLGYANPCECLEYEVSYFHYDTTASNHVAAVPTSFSSDIGASSSGVRLLFSNFNGSQSDIDFCSAHLKLDIDMVDFDIGNTFCWNSCVEFNPFIGLRYAKIDQKLKVVGSNNGVGERAQNIVSVASIYLGNNFEGLGLHAGLNLDWRLGCGFGLYGNCAGSLLYGHNCVNSRTDYFESNFDSGTLTRNDVFSKSKTRGPRAILEAEIGVNWNYNLFDSYLVRLKLGWSNLLFLNANRFDNSILVEKSQVFSVSRQGDLGLQGLVFGGDIFF